MQHGIQVEHAVLHGCQAARPSEFACPTLAFSADVLLTLAAQILFEKIRSDQTLASPNQQQAQDEGFSGAHSFQLARTFV
jgi:hypothetical protein